MTIAFNTEILKYVLIRSNSSSVREYFKNVNVNIENWMNIRHKLSNFKTPVKYSRDFMNLSICL